MPDPHRVLFVCLGNICRSPAAEIIFRHQIQNANRTHEFTVDSAGTIGYHAGKPPDPRMSETLQRHGYSISGRSRQFTPKDFEAFDLILTMDEGNYHEILSLDPDGDHHGKVKPFVSYLQELDASNIPDPYYGGQQGFEHVIELLQDGCQGILSEH